MSLNHAQAIAFQDYTRAYQEAMFAELFYGFKTSTLVQMFEGIKGELILTQLEVADNMARRWGKTFDPSDVAALKPRKLKTVLNKVDFSITPQEYEFSYLGALRQKGQDPADWPFQAYIMEKILAKLNQEFETAVWQGVESDTPSAGDYLRETYNGYLKLIVDAVTAGTITPVVTGAVSAANIIANLRLMWAAVGVAYKENGTDIFMSYTLYDYYRTAYKDAYKVDPAYIMINDAGYQGVLYELGNGNTRIIPIAGMGTSGRVVITPRENLAFGTDDPADVMFNVEAQKRELHFWMDFRQGVQILIQKDGVLVVNDQV